MGKGYLLLLFGPVIFAYLNGRIYPLQFEKIFYLCPMETEQRKKYIKKRIFFRRMIPVLLGIPAIYVAIAGEYYDFVSVIQFILQLGIAAFVCADNLVHARQFLCCGIAWFGIAAYYGMSLFENIFEQKTKIIFGAVILLIELPFVIGCYKQQKETVERLSSFEGGGLCR